MPPAAPATGAPANPCAAPPDAASSLAEIADRLAKLRFRKCLWGASEQDVWHKVRRLDEMYRGLYRDQEARYRELVAERNALLRELQRRRSAP